MTDHIPTADELSRGRAFWLWMVKRAQHAFTRTVGDDRLQQVLDLEARYRVIAAACKTYGPCSRECVG